MSKGDLSYIKTSDHATIRCICDVKIKKQHSIKELRIRLDIEHIEDVQRWN